MFCLKNFFFLNLILVAWEEPQFIRTEIYWQDRIFLKSSKFLFHTLQMYFIFYMNLHI